MTVKDKIQQDGVTMRWIRTFGTTVTTTAAAFVVLWTSAVWVFGPRVTSWAEDLVDGATAEMRADLEQNAAHLGRLDEIVRRLEQTTALLSSTAEVNAAPSWRFDPVDTTISDGVIGGDVQIVATGYKLRDCGVPIVDLYFINGGGVYHRFVDASILTSDGRGVALPVNPTRTQSLTYTATIPANDGVSPGRALGYISLVYPQCPAVEASVAGPLQFRIGRGDTQ